MDRFSEAYEKARDVISNQKFAEDWQKHLETKVMAKGLLAESGPDYKFAEGLSQLRDKIKSASNELKKTDAEVILVASETGRSGGTKEARAATIKLLKHFYLSQKRGAQDVWIYSPPVDYSKWIYEEIEGTEKEIETKLTKEQEVYSSEHKKVMGEGITTALKIAQKVMVLLGDLSDETKTVVRRWFDDGTADEEDLKGIVATLLNGFKKIVSMANSNEVIFSDEPLDRVGGGWKDWAFIYKNEKMPVIYIQNAWLKAANSGKLERCARTIIHELSHKAVGTKDRGYGWEGLKPGGKKVSRDDAIVNADSWAHFALDLNGVLTKSEREEALV